MKTGFDNAKYIQLQKQHIQERISQFSGKLYLEFGGKLFDDYHAARVLPGFDVNGKIRLLYEMRQDAEIIFCISADDIEKTKVRADLGIGYDMEVLRLIDDITAMGIPVNSVVITRYTGQSAADAFARKLTSRGVKNYIHRPIEGYPADIAHICSDEVPVPAAASWPPACPRYTTSTAGATWRATPSLRPSPSGTSP